MAQITAEQLAHLREHQQAFDEHQLEEGADLAAYFDEHDEDEPGELYVALCSDLELKPVMPRGFGL